ncbi:MAG: pyruvate ferredoxin oxidoreductase [Patescibacteria group bacterium]
MNNQSRQILEGSQAIARIVRLIDPAVVSAYPITPQTHIVEDLAKMKAQGEAKFAYLRAESEFAAASIILGASATGVRVYSATSSQGLLLMTEVIYNIAGMRLPVVMTCANRSVSSPINIWNDHSDVMSIRDAGWIQLFAGTNQEAVYQHLLAYRLAESLHLPVMVNVDGFILTHSYEPIIIPAATLVKRYLPPYRPNVGTYLDPRRPVTLGAFFGPQHYMETREQLQSDLVASLKVIERENRRLRQVFNIKPAEPIDNGLLEYSGPPKPTAVLVALGSVTGTIQAALRRHKTTGLLKIKTYRPFPAAAVVAVLGRAKNVAVIEKAVSLGQAGPLYSDIAAALAAAGGCQKIRLKDYIVGLGGRDVTEKMADRIIRDVPKHNAYLKFIGQI